MSNKKRKQNKKQKSSVHRLKKLTRKQTVQSKTNWILFNVFRRTFVEIHSTQQHKQIWCRYASFSALITKVDLSTATIDWIDETRHKTCKSWTIQLKGGIHSISLYLLLLLFFFFFTWKMAFNFCFFYFGRKENCPPLLCRGCKSFSQC